MRKTIFISDLHLSAGEQSLTALFLRWLVSCEDSIDAVYILGDLFEQWIGDDYVTSFSTNVIQALRTVTTSGKPVYFLHGNRDFLIGKRFLKETGCTLLAAVEKIYLYGVPVLVMHGDQLCTLDRSYQRMKVVLRHPLTIKLAYQVPIWLRLGIANQLRKLSQHDRDQQYQSGLKENRLPDKLDVVQETVEKVMRQYAVTWLIHGHTHRPYSHVFPLAHVSATRIVLGAWHPGEGSIYIWESTGKKGLYCLTEKGELYPKVDVLIE